MAQKSDESKTSGRDLLNKMSLGVVTVPLGIWAVIVGFNMASANEGIGQYGFLPIPDWLTGIVVVGLGVVLVVGGMLAFFGVIKEIGVKTVGGMKRLVRRS